MTEERRAPGSRSLAVAIVLAAVIVAVMTVFFVVDARSRPDSPETPSAEPVPAQNGQETDPVRSPSIAIDAARTDLLPALPALPPGPEAAGDGLRVRVIDGRTNAPVAGATVMLLDQSPEARTPIELATREGLDRREILERFAKAAVTDSDGIARFDWPRTSVSVSCEHAGLFGQHEIQRAPTSAIDLVLDPDEALLVRVLDARGTPAPGVSVDWVEDVNGAGISTLARAVSRASDGLAVFEHPQLVRRRSELMRTFVTPSILLGEAALVPVDGARSRDRVLEIALPELGSLEFCIVDSEGQPAVGWSDVFMRISSRRIESMQAAGVRVARHEIEHRSLGSRHAFEHVGLGLELDVGYFVGLGGGYMRPMHGPREPGERMTVDLMLPAGGDVLRARVLDVDGTPVSWRKVSLSYWDRGRPTDASAPQRSVSCTDGEGLIGEPLPRDELQDLALRLEIVTESPTARKRASARIDLPLPLPRAAFDLGDVPLEVDPVIVAGRVVDETGAPIPWAYVWADAVREREYVVAGVERLPEHGAHAYSDVAGRFEVRSRQGPTGLRVNGRHEDYGASNDVEVVFGAHDVVLVLSSTGSIAGRAILFPGVRPQLYRLSFELRPTSSTQATCSWQNDGSFRFSRIAPATYDLTLLFDPERAQLGHWSGLAIRANQSLRDEHLAAIDLRSSLRVLTITLTDPEGEPVRDGHVEYRESNDSGVWLNGAHMMGAGRYGMPTTYPEIDARIEAPGFAPQEVARISGDHRIQLERGPAVRVVLGGALPRIGEEWCLAVLLRLQDPMPTADASANAIFEFQGLLRIPAPSANAVLDASGVARAHVSVAGTYAVTLSLERTEGWYGGHIFDPFADQGFTVDEASIEQLIELPALDPEWIERIERAARDDW